MLRWLTENAVLYGCVLGLSFLGRRRIALVLRSATAAWVVVALRYLPSIDSLIRDIWSGGCGVVCVTQWAVFVQWTTVVVAPLASAYLLCGRDAVASILILLLAANWLLFELIDVHFVCLQIAYWTCAVPFLGLVTILAVGSYAVRSALRDEAERPRGRPTRG
jgi:hypothetical protein